MLREMFVVVDGNATSYASGHLMLAGQGWKRPLSPGVVERSSVLRQEIRRGGLTTQRAQRYSLLTESGTMSLDIVSWKWPN